MWPVLYKLREQRLNYPYFNCVLRKLKQLKKKIKRKKRTKGIRRKWRKSMHYTIRTLF